MEKKRFVFIAHWVETWNWMLWWNKDLHRHPEHAWRWIWLYPVYFAASVFYLFGKKSHDVVDTFKFNGLEGKIVLIRSFGWHFFINGHREKIRQKIFQAVLKEQAGADVIGLGALTKAEWLTRGGKRVVEKLGGRLKVPIVHGDTLTAATVIKRILQLNLSPVFMTGATSKIGRAVALDLASRGITVKLFTESEGRFNEILEETEATGGYGKFLVNSLTLEDGKNCPLWVTGKAIPAGMELLKNIPKGAVVLNFSVPNPVSERAKKARLDVRFYEGGLLAFDPEKSTQSFNMRLWPGETYACHAGTMVHAYKGWTHNEVGPVDMKLLWPTYEAAEELGFFLSPLPQRQEQEATGGNLWGLIWQKARGFASFLS